MYVSRIAAYYVHNAPSEDELNSYASHGNYEKNENKRENKLSWTVDSFKYCMYNAALLNNIQATVQHEQNSRLTSCTGSTVIRVLLAAR